MSNGFVSDGDGCQVFGRPPDRSGPTAPLGTFKAPDGSAGARVGLDVDRPHVGLIVGKRGSGKSNTLAVVTETLGHTAGIAPVLVDPLGEFDTLASGVPVDLRSTPRIRGQALEPGDWCTLLDLDPAGAVGGLVWQVAERTTSLDAMREQVADADAVPETVRAARNHLRHAQHWDVFATDGLSAEELLSGPVSVLDLSAHDRVSAGAVIHVVANCLYGAAVASASGRLPWLLIDEAATALTELARPAVRRAVTRGRTPGVSVILATQRPGALPSVTVSQADLLIAHRLTAESDIEALERASPTYLADGVTERLPDRRGNALVVDDATERATTVHIRERTTPHGGTTPRSRHRRGRLETG